MGYFLLGSEVYITVLKTLWKMFKTPQGSGLRGDGLVMRNFTQQHFLKNPGKVRRMEEESPAFCRRT